MHNAYIEIDKQQFICNLKSISQWVNKDLNNKQPIKLCLPVKANAYGHGIVEMAKISESHVDYLAVACVDEAVILKQSGITKPILVFGSFSKEQVADLVLNNFEVTVSSFLEADLLIAFCKDKNLISKIHLKIDTGMNRVGIDSKNAFSLIDYINNSESLNLVGVYSHLACSDIQNDEFTHNQIKQFAEIVKKVKQINPEIICHLANSGGICYYPESYFDMVRPGIFSYGYWHNEVMDITPLNQVKPCFSLKSKVVFLKTVKANTGISYNHKYVTKNATKIATIPIGYGDGYRRLLTNLGEVLINGQKYTVSGTVCMDMIMVDVGNDTITQVNDEVILIGTQQDQEVSLYSMAKICNTITYEILCGFTSRLPRVYI